MVLDPVHVLSQSELLLLTVVQLLLQYLHVHLTLLVHLVHAALRVDHVLELHLHLLKPLLQLPRPTYTLSQLLLCHSQFFPLHVPLIINRPNLNAIVLYLVPQIEELRLGVLELAVEPECCGVVAVVGAVDGAFGAVEDLGGGSVELLRLQLVHLLLQRRVLLLQLVIAEEEFLEFGV